MGDIADEIVDRMMEGNEYDGYEFYDGHTSPACKVCHKTNLKWYMTPAGWRLFEGKQLHECADPFKIVAALEKKKRSNMFFTSGMKNPIPLGKNERRRKVILK